MTWEEVPRDEALDRDDIAFNTKTEEGVDGETVRVVTVDDWDVAACGGTHVGNTREMGPDGPASNPEWESSRRVAVGPRAIRRRATEHERTMTAAQSLDTNVAELPAAVDGLQSMRRPPGDGVVPPRAPVDSRLADLRDDAIEVDGQRWLVGTVAGLDANALADRAESAVGDDVDVPRWWTPTAVRASGRPAASTPVKWSIR